MAWKRWRPCGGVKLYALFQYFYQGGLNMCVFMGTDHTPNATDEGDSCSDEK